MKSDLKQAHLYPSTRLAKAQFFCNGLAEHVAFLPHLCASFGLFFSSFIYNYLILEDLCIMILIALLKKKKEKTKSKNAYYPLPPND